MTCRSSRARSHIALVTAFAVSATCSDSVSPDIDSELPPSSNAPTNGITTADVTIAASDNFDRLQLGPNWQRSSIAAAIVGSIDFGALAAVPVRIDWIGMQFAADQYSEATLAQRWDPNMLVRVHVRRQSGTGAHYTFHYNVERSPAAWQIVHFNEAGQGRVLETVLAPGPRPGDAIGIAARGAQITGFVNGRQLLTAWDRSTSALLVSGTAGIGARIRSGTSVQMPAALVARWRGGSLASACPTCPVPTSLSLQTQPSGAMTGEPFAVQPVVHILDQWGQIIQAGEGSTLDVTATRFSGTGALGGTTTVRAVAGVAAFSDLEITGAGPHVIAFSTAGPTLRVSSNTVDVAPIPTGPATQLVVVVQPTAVTSGVKFATAPVVELRDVAGNRTQSTAQVTVAIANGAGSLSGTTTKTAVAGVATFTDLAIAGTGPHSLTFRSSGLTSTTSSVFTVSPGPARTLVFASDWSTGTGEGAAAMLDTRQAIPWDRQFGNGNGNEVVAATGLGFPAGMTNVLKAVMEWNGSGAATDALRLDNASKIIPVPDVGEGIFYRWYIRIDTPDTFTADDSVHPFQDGFAVSDCNWWFRVITRTNGTWVPELRMANANTWPNYGWQGPALAKGVVYRFEVNVHRNAASTYQIHVRVFNSTNTLLYDDDDFANLSGTATLASNPSHNFDTLENLAGFNAGHNGVVGGTVGQFPYIHSYQGGFAICVMGWCGAYVAGEGL